MSLRTNRVLKVFAILLFSLEMIAPALISSFSAEAETSRQKQFHSNESQFARFFTSVVFEESNGDEERESKDHKTNLIFAGFDFSEARVYTVSACHQAAWVELYEISASQPPLFTLFHTYII